MSSDVSIYTDPADVNTTFPVTPENGTSANATSLAAQEVVIGVSLAILIVLTIFGNLLVITAVGTFHRLRTVTNYFVVSLAVADLTVAVLVMPSSVLYEVQGRWRFGWVFCYFWISCDVTCCTASILHLCVISLDRYLAITQPLTYQSKMSKKRALMMIAGVWICSVAISFLPIYLGWYADTSLVELYVDSPQCGLFVNKIYAVISSTTSFYIPLLVMAVAYVRIFRIAQKQAREIKQLEVTYADVTPTPDADLTVDKVRRRSKRLQRDSKAIKTLGTLMGLFCVSWLPFFLMYLILPFCENCNVPKEAESFITWLGYVNSGINPCVYAYLNRDFRQAFKRLLSCGRDGRWRCCCFTCHRKHGQESQNACTCLKHGTARDLEGVDEPALSRSGSRNDTSTVLHQCADTEKTCNYALLTCKKFVGDRKNGTVTNANYMEVAL